MASLWCRQNFLVFYSKTYKALAESGVGEILYYFILPDFNKYFIINMEQNRIISFFK